MARSRFWASKVGVDVGKRGNPRMAVPRTVAALEIGR